MTELWKWHCIKFVPRSASEVEASLLAKRIPVYFPLRWQRVKAGREMKWDVSPRLGSYAFAQINHDPAEKALRVDFIATQLHEIKSVRGVWDVLVNRNGDPAPIRNAEIDALKSEVARERAEQDLPASRRRTQHGYPSETLVRILRGPFESLEAEIVMYESHGMVRVVIQIFGRPTTTTLPDCDIAPLEKTATRSA
jgi:transcription antitermination factor NusG